MYSIKPVYSQRVKRRCIAFKLKRCRKIFRMSSYESLKITEIADKEISDYIYAATFIGESPYLVLKMLSLSAPICYTLSTCSKMVGQTDAKQTARLYKKNI